MTRRSSAGTTRPPTAPDAIESPAPPAVAPVPPAPGPPPEPPAGNAPLVLFGLIIGMNAVLSVVEMLIRGPGPVVYLTAGQSILMILLGPWYKAGRLARRPGPDAPGEGPPPPSAAPGPPLPAPPTAEAPPGGA